MNLFDLQNGTLKFPPEFANHRATIAMIPFRTDIWRDNAVHAQSLMLEIIDIISLHEKIVLCTNKNLSSFRLPRFNSNVELVEIPYNDIWARDTSPFFVCVDGELTGIKFGFNAWGGMKEGSYYPWDDDASFADSICTFLKIRSKSINVILEGGAIANNGAGVLITTESVLLNPNRNPHSTKEIFEEIFSSCLGAQKVIWLNQGFYGDETDGHIDVFLNFVDEHNILLAWTDNPQHPQYHILQNAYNVLSNECAMDGKPFTIHKLTMPETMIITDEEALGIIQHENALKRTADMMLYPTYNNAYIFNGGVLVPVFNSDKDIDAISLYQKLFKDRKVYPIYSKEFLIGGGNFHCIFHEIPEV